MKKTEIKKCCICGKDILDNWAYEKIDVKRESCFSDTIIITEYVCNKCDKPKSLTIRVLVKKIAKGIFKIKVGNRKWKFLKKLNV